MSLEKVIEQLGFSPKEARVYLAVLVLGESRITDIAKKVKLPRTSAQAIADKLYEKGYIDFYIMNRYKYWVAVNPERLLTHLKKQEEILGEIMPELTRLRNSKAKGINNITKSLGLLKMIADTASQPVLITNGDIDIEYVNAAWEDQFGYSLKEVKGKNPNILKSNKTPEEVYKEMWKALNTEKMFQSDEVVDMRKDGTTFNMLTTIFTVRHNGNIFFIQILDDITDRKGANLLGSKFAQVSDQR